MPNIVICVYLVELNGYRDIGGNILFKNINEDRQMKGHEKALVKEKDRLDEIKYQFSHRKIN